MSLLPCSVETVKDSVLKLVEELYITDSSTACRLLTLTILCPTWRELQSTSLKNQLKAKITRLLSQPILEESQLKTFLDSVLVVEFATSLLRILEKTASDLLSMVYSRSEEELQAEEATWSPPTTTTCMSSTAVMAPVATVGAISLGLPTTSASLPPLQAMTEGGCSTCGSIWYRAQSGVSFSGQIPLPGALYTKKTCISTVQDGQKKMQISWEEAISNATYQNLLKEGWNLIQQNQHSMKQISRAQPYQKKKAYWNQ